MNCFYDPSCYGPLERFPMQLTLNISSSVFWKYLPKALNTSQVVVTAVVVSEVSRLTPRKLFFTFTNFITHFFIEKIISLQVHIWDISMISLNWRQYKCSSEILNCCFKIWQWRWPHNSWISCIKYPKPFCPLLYDNNFTIYRNSRRRGRIGL